MHTNNTRPQATSRAKTVFISDLDTPCLLLNEAQMNCNINSLHSRLASKTVTFRPHLKTTKAIEIARRMVTGAHGPATVSTLNEAEAVASAGITDITYAVGISPQKIFRRCPYFRANASISSDMTTKRSLLRLVWVMRISPVSKLTFCSSSSRPSFGRKEKILP